MAEPAAASVARDPDRLRAVRRLSLPAAPDEALDRFAALVELLVGAPVAVIPRDDRVTHRRRVPAGSTLVLYTDGLVEEPGRLIDAGIARVVERLRGRAAVGAQELCARLVEAAPRRTDDIALLLVRFGG